MKISWMTALVLEILDRVKEKATVGDLINLVGRKCLSREMVEDALIVVQEPSPEGVHQDSPEIIAAKVEILEQILEG